MEQSTEWPRCSDDGPMESRMDYITRHFLALSAGATCFGAMVAIMFVAGYLTVFDRAIIWVVEYPDLIKFALIGVAVFAAYTGFIGGPIQDLFAIGRQSGKVKFISVGLLIAFFLGLAIFEARSSYLIGDYDKVWEALLPLTIII